MKYKRMSKFTTSKKQFLNTQTKEVTTEHYVVADYLNPETGKTEPMICALKGKHVYKTAGAATIAAKRFNSELGEPK